MNLNLKGKGERTFDAIVVGSGISGGWAAKELSIGLGIHEMGTARMGSSPKESVLNKYNQVWGAQNVFCTDGAAMTSAGCQNPSLTYMALTARAADYAVSEMKKGNI